MNELFIVIAIFIYVLTVAYFILIFNYWISWERIKTFFISQKENKTFISVIIAARNEEKNIEQCLHHVCKQNYPSSIFEIIVVNDFSEDTTQQVVESFIQSNKQCAIKLINLTGNGGKKAAIAAAVKEAKGELIITTDADCIMDNNWVKTIAGYYESHGSYLISAPVIISGVNLFGKIQSLEFMSLIGTGAAAIQTGYPLMCNAANLAFKRDVYFEMGREVIKNEPLSGDDTFLMFAIHKKYPRKIAFLKSHDAIVTTLAHTTLKDFLNQRIRWTSKVKRYSNYYVQYIGIFLFVFNMMILFSGVAAMFYKPFLNIFLIQLIAKLLIDVVFLFRLSYFFHNKKLLLFFFLVEIIHVFYLIFIPLTALSGSYEWKKRKVKE